jgi:hypothetical protein
MQEAVFALTPSPNLSPKGERNMKRKVEVTGLCWERATPWRSLWMTNMSATKRGGYSACSGALPAMILR